MRRGFSMIELIFVIVILGILASVALPKLAATRDDAKASATAEMISNLKKSAEAYALASGQTITATNIGQVFNWSKEWTSTGCTGTIGIGGTAPLLCYKDSAGNEWMAVDANSSVFAIGFAGTATNFTNIKQNLEGMFGITISDNIDLDNAEINVSVGGSSAISW